MTEDEEAIWRSSGAWDLAGASWESQGDAERGGRSGADVEIVALSD